MNISGIDIEIIKKNIKNLHLSVLPPDGKVRVSAPLSISEEAIELFAISKIGWIKKQIEEFQNQPRQTEREYVSGESHYFFGNRYRMDIRYTKGNSKVEIQGNKMLFTIRPDSTVEQRASTLNEWYRKQLRVKLPTLFEKWEEIIGVHANEVKIKDMLTKWGTCNVTDKRIWINLQLAKKPLPCLEYVVVHELVHFKENTHNQHFVLLMDQYLPDWRARKETLNSFIMQNYISTSNSINLSLDDDI